jgi:alkylated DNA repair dioxygenase AlkB
MIEHMYPSGSLDGSAAPQLAWQGSLFGLDDPAVDPRLSGCERHQLDEWCWVDHVPRWLQGSDLVFVELVARLPWRRRQVVMYDHLVDEPRLSCWWRHTATGPPEPLAVLGDARTLLAERYDRPFDSIGFNLYRDGRDSVAWHGDRVGGAAAEPVVAVLSVGAPRPFLLRPRGGGASRGFLLGQGDLLVMGGDCQARWEHTVPKVSSAAGPRISVTFRHGAPGVPGATLG